MQQFVDFMTPGGTAVVVNKELVLYFAPSQNNRDAVDIKMTIGASVPVGESMEAVQAKLNYEE
jgi:hypothetical protein